MKPYYEEKGITIWCADCKEILPKLSDVSAVVTDPPYGLKFMGKDWDKGIPGVEFWRLILAACKPGAHLLAFGGTRTHHRLMCALEDAGWEIRDCLMWLYGTGFPKSMDVSSAIDKALEVGRVEIGRRSGRTGPAVQPNGGSVYSDDNYQWPGEFSITNPATEAAKQWYGWGTALKPAWEPIIMARKPIEETVARNVQKYGTGALNIDTSRIEYQGDDDKSSATCQGKCTSKPGALAGGTQHEVKRVDFERPKLKGR